MQLLLGRPGVRAVSGFCLLAAIAFTVRAQTMTFTTFAGPAGGQGLQDGAAGDARFNFPRGIALDAAGNCYVADMDNNSIRKISPDGSVTTLAGSPLGFPGSSNGVGGYARFTAPIGVATDSSGNVYVADLNNEMIRKIAPSGSVTTFAGSRSSGAVDGPAETARFNGPYGVAADSAGNLYVSDAFNYTIRKITPAGIVSTIAGTARQSGTDDGTGSAARFKFPAAIAVDHSGNLYIADESSYTIRKVTPAGVVTTLAGLAGKDGSTDGTGSNARFRRPFGVAADLDGNVYVADASTLRKITPAGVVTTLAGSATLSGSADGAGDLARFGDLNGVATDSAGNIYVTDGNGTIRKVTAAGVVTTLAGTAGSGKTDGARTAARFWYPLGVAASGSGTVFVADTGNHTIRKITPAGVVTTLAGLAGSAGNADGTGSDARFDSPSGIATDSSGNAYVADTGNSTIRKITPAGVVTTLAGMAGSPGSDDGTGTSARFSGVAGIATDHDGNVYVSETYNRRIRKITSGGVVTTLAGSGAEGSADGAAFNAQFKTPSGVAADGAGNVYVADTGGCTIRKITPAGDVSTFAGSAANCYSTDGTGSAARFYQPMGVATDGSGNVYVADSYGQNIRMITPARVVTTIAGQFLGSGSADGTGGTAQFFLPSAIAADAAGNLYVADSANNKIRIGRPALTDVAAIDSPTGAAFASRRLDSSPRTATSWQWVILRRPSGSTAVLSSTSIRDPQFVPDKGDVYTFQLTASNGTALSITTVQLSATELRRHAAEHR